MSGLPDQLEQLTMQLYQILPAEFQQDIPQLAKIIDDLVSRKVDVPVAQALLTSIPQISKIAHSLAGRSINYYDTLLSFGTNNQFGDVFVENVAGGDIFKLDIILVSSKNDVSRFSLLIDKASHLLSKDISKKRRPFWPVAVLVITSLVLTLSPFVPTWIPAAGVVAAFVSQWFMIENQDQVGWIIWCISLATIVLLSLVYLPFLVRLL